jgi:tRNA threonylcarbamoyladenosine biosynthesis protein TsaE
VVRTVETAGPQATEALGGELAASLRAGDIVLVAGELGVGKTTLVRGACRALGVATPVTSPTFTIGSRYATPGGLEISHIDLYRIASLAEEDPDLLADYLGGGRVAFIEWPDAAGPELEVPRMRITLSHLGGDRRRIEVVE